MTPCVLIVEDDRVLAENIREYLVGVGWEAQVSGSVKGGLALMESARPDILLADYRLPDGNGIELIKQAVSQEGHLKAVLITGEGSIQVAVEAIKAGAYDYLGKPVSLAELKLLLERAWDAVRAEKALAFYRNKQASGAGAQALLGESSAMLKIKETVGQIIEMESRVIDGEMPAVLITGETGTGKELVARALHFDGRRRERPFVEVNCASIPANLLEAELFGHEKGAFTDAKERKVGLVESAEGGTLFLDEIGEVDIGTQAKLLKLLEERTVRRIGSVRERKVNVRIVSATNRDLERMVQEGRFRADLYFRLRIVTVHMPPLRERGRDILLLARHFLALHARRYGRQNLEFAPDAETMLLMYAWPGNVRELRNVLEQTVLLTRDRIIAAAGIALHRIAPLPEEIAKSASPVGAKLANAERELVMQALEKTDWNVSKAARILGVTRDVLRTRLRRHGLARARRAHPNPGGEQRGLERI